MTFPVGFNSRLDDVVASTEELRAVPTAASAIFFWGLGFSFFFSFFFFGGGGLGFRV